ncbi:hypothetical protein BRADI_1g57142v3 [Brachypodium distachyon]|uniref:Uncharacterized protein n=1 Tax=Brachypodium distachyon TaxID=15368 RepID=A0A0Q3S6W7_BRADI|nr:hypothetical protein BRADI_1g57142v3 [Brachypodium distachyon]
MVKFHTRPRVRLRVTVKGRVVGYGYGRDVLEPVGCHPKPPLFISAFHMPQAANQQELYSAEQVAHGRSFVGATPQIRRRAADLHMLGSGDLRAIFLSPPSPACRKNNWGKLHTPLVQ